MGKLIAVLVIVVGIGLAGFGVFSYLQSQKPNAGLKIDSTPTSVVFIDNVQVGVTPFEKIFKPGEVSIKLIPNSTSTTLSTYQTKIHLTAKTYSVIKRDFGESDASSAGEIVNLEPQSGRGSSMAVIVSGPDSASVMLDGQPQGFTPLLVPSLVPGDHQIVVSAPGFTERLVQAKSVAGYKLNVAVKLAGVIQPLPAIVETTPDPATPSASPTPRTSPKPTPSPKAALTKPYVQVKSTPTGFLRVRLEPSTQAKEIGRVDPGDNLPLLDSVTGWYQVKVDFEATSSGWISSQYADKFD